MKDVFSGRSLYSSPPQCLAWSPARPRWSVNTWWTRGGAPTRWAPSAEGAPGPRPPTQPRPQGQSRAVDTGVPLRDSELCWPRQRKPFGRMDLSASLFSFLHNIDCLKWAFSRGKDRLLCYETNFNFLQNILIYFIFFTPRFFLCLAYQRSHLRWDIWEYCIIYSWDAWAALELIKYSFTFKSICTLLSKVDRFIQSIGKWLF